MRAGQVSAKAMSLEVVSGKKAHASREAIRRACAFAVTVMAWQASVGWASDITVSNITGTPITVTTSYPLTDVGFITFDTNPGGITYSGQITDSGTNGLTKIGSGVLTLSNTNSYNAGTQINAGTISLGNANAIGAGAINFGGGVLKYGSIFATDLSSRFTAIPAGVVAGIDTGGNSVTFASVIAGSGGLQKLGSGTLTLAAANSYTGATWINQGVLSLGSAAALGSGSINFGGGTLQYGDGVTADLSARFSTISPGSYASIDTGANSVTFATGICGSGGLTKLGSGTLTLSAANTYTGVTAVNTGTLRLNNASALRSGASLSLAGGMLDLNNNSISVSALSGASGIIGNSGGASNTVMTFANGISTFGGTIQDALGLAVSSGALTLSGSNTYSGGTTISGGTLLATKAAALPGYNSAGKMVVGDAGTLVVPAGGTGQWTANDIESVLANATFSPGSTLGISVASGSLTYGSNIIPPVGLAKLGTGTLVLSGSNSYSGTTQINAGVLSVANANALGSGGISFGGGTLQYGGNFSTDFSGRFVAIPAGVSAGIDTGANNVIFASPIGGAGGMAKYGSGTLVLAAANTFTGPLLLAGGVLTANTASLNGGDSAQGITFSGGTLRAATGGISTAKNVTLNSVVFDSNGYDSSLSGSITGNNTSLIKVGSGSLSLTGCSGTLFNGSITISEGTLNVRSGGQITNPFWHVGGQGSFQASLGVDGTGSVLNATSILIGKSGSANFTVSNGATAYGAGYLGYDAGLSGSAVVTGNGATWSTNSKGLFVGYNGQGDLTIANGGTVYSGGVNGQYTFIGYNAGSTGRVTVDGAKWVSQGDEMHVGIANSTGIVYVTNGGQVSATGTTWIGYGSGSTGTVAISGAGSKWVANGFYVGDYIGGTGTGSIAISDGATVSGSTTIGSHGSGIVTGNGSTWNANTLSIVGGGTLAIAHQATLSSMSGTVDASGSVSVDGNGSTWVVAGGLQVGAAKTGSLVLSNGASLTTRFGDTIGRDSGSNGSISVRDAGSAWNNQGYSLLVGYDGSGALNILNGAAVSSGGAQLGTGRTSTGNATVDGSGSTWSSAGDLYAGYYGAGNITVTGGGTVTNTGNVYLGYDNGYGTSNGTVTVSDSNSALISTGSVYVGGNTGFARGTGVLSTANGGRVEVGGTLRVYGARGSLQLNGGTIRASSLVSDSTALFALDTAGGTLDLSGASTISGSVTGSGGLTKAGVGRLMLSANNTYTGPTLISAGALALSGNYANNIVSSSTITIANGATLDATGLRAGTLALSSGQTFVNNGTLLGSLVASGTVSGNGTVGALSVLAGGIIAPGNSVGAIVVHGNLDLAGTYAAELDPAASGMTADLLDVTGAVHLTGATLNVTLMSAPTLGQAFTIIKNDGGDSVTDTFVSLDEGSLVDATYAGQTCQFVVSYQGNADGGGVSNDVILTTVAVPEATSLSLMAVSVFGLLSRKRRRDR